MTTAAMATMVDDLGPLARFAQTTAVSLTVDPATPYEGWAALMGVLGEVGRGVLWWSGDALLQGEALFGEKYSAAMHELHLEYQSLANRVWVSRKVPPAIRRVELSWTHHQCVAGLATQREMESWLAKALAERWDSKALAKAIRKAGAAGHSGRGTDATDAAPSVGAAVERAVRAVLRERFAKLKKPAEWAAKTLGTRKLRDKEVQAWAKAVRAHVEHALDV